MLKDPFKKKMLKDKHHKLEIWRKKIYTTVFFLKEKYTTVCWVHWF